MFGHGGLIADSGVGGKGQGCPVKPSCRTAGAHHYLLNLGWRGLGGDREMEAREVAWRWGRGSASERHMLDLRPTEGARLGQGNLSIGSSGEGAGADIGGNGMIPALYAH